MATKERTRNWSRILALASFWVGFLAALMSTCAVVGLIPLPLAAGLCLAGLVFALVGLWCVHRGPDQRRAWVGLALGLGGFLVAAVVAPANRRVLGGPWHEYHGLRSDGKNIYTAVFADAVDGNVVGFPRSDVYSNASDYVRALAADEARVVPAGPEYFRGPGMETADDWASFGPEHCAWCFVADTGADTAAGYPFAISSNVRGRWVSDLRGRVGDTLDPGHPMGVQCAVVAFHGGGSEVLKADQSWDEVLAAFRDQPDRPILRP